MRGYVEAADDQDVRRRKILRRNQKEGRGTQTLDVTFILFSSSHVYGGMSVFTITCLFAIAITVDIVLNMLSHII